MITANTILEIARAELGTKETPAGSNNVKYNTDYYGRAVSGSEYPWCCAFVYWCFKQADALALFAGGQKTAWCPYAMHWYENYGVFNSDIKSFLPGDVIFFNFQGGKTPGHIGIVERVNADGSVLCLEGNTSVTSQDNGGCVMYRTRTPGVILGAGRPDYETEDIMVTYAKLTDIPNDWGARDVIGKLMDAGIIKGDGSDPTGNDDIINITYDQLRTLVMLYRGGGFDRALIAAGFEPAIA